MEYPLKFQTLAMIIAAIDNTMDRFHLVMAAIDRVSKLQDVCAHVKQLLWDKLIELCRNVSTETLE